MTRVCRLTKERVFRPPVVAHQNAQRTICGNCGGEHIAHSPAGVVGEKRGWPTAGARHAIGEAFALPFSENPSIRGRPDVFVRPGVFLTGTLRRGGDLATGYAVGGCGRCVLKNIALRLPTSDLRLDRLSAVCALFRVRSARAPGKRCGASRPQIHHGGAAPAAARAWASATTARGRTECPVHLGSRFRRRLLVAAAYCPLVV